jgi:RNA 2',3'-cyclic 3'-phosphodiesterase
MRCFLAVDVSDEIRKKVAVIQKELRSTDIKLVEENNLHFTLKFLGEVSSTDIENIMPPLGRLAAATKTFDIAIRGVGAFPNNGNPRVLWLGAEGEKFVGLYEAVNGALAGMFEEERATPHLTIARVRAAGTETANFLSRHKNTEIGHVAVDRIVLKKSVLTGGGPVYENVAAFELARG